MSLALPKPWLDLPMFFTEGHAALGDELLCALVNDDSGLHTVEEVSARLSHHRLYSLLIPRKSGGRKVDREDRVDVRALCVARELLAYVSPLADAVFAVQGLSTYPFVLSETAPRREHVFRAVLKGERLGGFGLTEPDAGSDVASMRTTARREADGFVLDGEKVFISNVGIASDFVVFANADPSLGKRGISAFQVSKDAPGLLLEAMPTTTDHPLGRLVMDNCRVPHEALLGEVGSGLRLALGTLDVFRTSVGAAAVGMATRALHETIHRVSKRVQFGQRLADFQLTQAALAEMKTELDAARLLVYRAAYQKDRGERATAEVAMAKMFATEAASRIIDKAVQLFGGLGVVEGSLVERLYREIRPLRIYEGTTEIQKLIIGSALVKDEKESAS